MHVASVLDLFVEMVNNSPPGCLAEREEMMDDGMPWATKQGGGFSSHNAEHYC